jgi:outer membrane lipoprotein-sorting protein
MADRVSEVLLEITPASQLVRIVFTEVEGATTEFRFASLKEDLEVSDRLFQFSPPPGVETVEGELGP